MAALAAAMASSRNCVLLTARKLAEPRFSAVMTSSVISTSMIRLTTSAAPRSRRNGTAAHGRSLRPEMFGNRTVVE